MKLEQVGQEHLGSIGFLSSSYCLFSIFKSPKLVKSLPCRALREGMTQSKKSIPSLTASIMFSGVPTPMR